MKQSASCFTRVKELLLPPHSSQAKLQFATTFVPTRNQPSETLVTQFMIVPKNNQIKETVSKGAAIVWFLRSKPPINKDRSQIPNRAHHKQVHGYRYSARIDTNLQTALAESTRAQRNKSSDQTQQVFIGVAIVADTAAPQTELSRIARESELPCISFSISQKLGEQLH